MTRHLARRGTIAAIAAALAITLIPTVPAHADDTRPTPATPTSTEAPADPAASPAPVTAAASDVREPHTRTVRLRVGLQDPRRITTPRNWAGRMLDDHDVTLDRDDLVEVHRNGRKIRRSEKRRLRSGDTIKVIRVTTSTHTLRRTLKPRIVTVHTTKIPQGNRRVASKGRPGVKKVKIIKTHHNRKVVDTHRHHTVIRAPQNRRILIGTRPPAPPGTGHLNWAALARCESSGNPRAVNPAGYYGLYQFNVATWRSVGGTGMPHHASAAEQTRRAQILYSRRGRSPWPHCGRYL